MGGGEKYFCSALEALATEHDVTLILPEEGVTPARLKEYFHLTLDSVRMAPIPDRARMPMLRSADLALILSNWYPLPVDPSRSVYILQIPYGPMGVRRILRDGPRGDFRESVKDLFRRSLLRRARAAAGVIVYSHFVQEILRRHHRIDATVLYPPIDDFGREGVKQPLILSVGRVFRGLYNDKRYPFLIEAFKELCRRVPGQPWEYWIVGSCGEDGESRKYLAELRSSAEGYPIVFHLNSPYSFLADCYHRAQLFWHAAGFGIDEARFPEQMEHFGMTTAEAMTAGCVPVVVNSGGQREIVAGGVSGTLWTTREELITATLGVMENPARASRMGAAARLRALEFGRDAFSRQVRDFFSQRKEHIYGST
jgi:glycosyltransferase involved in cell wall biosynthesis